MGKILIIIHTTNTKYSNYFFLFYQFFDISRNYSLRYGLGRYKHLPRLGRNSRHFGYNFTKEGGLVH